MQKFEYKTANYVTAKKIIKISICTTYYMPWCISNYCTTLKTPKWKSILTLNHLHDV